MKFEEIIKSMSGHEMKAEEINRNAKYAKETFGLTDEADDALKILFLVTSKAFQDYIFESTYKNNRRVTGETPVMHTAKVVRPQVREKGRIS